MPVRSYLRRMRARLAEEHGAVLIIVAGCMVMFLAAGAMAIDLGAARQNQTKAQSAADASAEAAATALAQGGSTTDATNAATSIATANGITNANVTVVTNYGGSSNQVEVIVRGNTPTPLGGESGSRSIPVMASAIAAVNTTTTVSSGTSTSTVTNTVTSTSTGTVTSMNCATAGNGCLAVYASGTSCNGDKQDSSDPVVFGGGVTITGGAWSDGSINLGGGGSTFGPLTYANGCSISPNKNESPPAYQQNSNTFNGGYPAAASPLTSWPIDYSQDFPSCSGSGCTGPSGTPSWCTQASTASSWSINTYNPVSMFTDNIYCAVGSGTASKPSTWTGALTVEGGGSNFYASFVAGSITIGGSTQLESCGYGSSGYTASNCASSVPAPVTTNYPLFYAVSGAVDDSNGGTSLTGDWFAPNGTITVGGGTNFVGFLEGQTVDMSAGGISGDGPPSSNGTVGSTSTTTSTSTSLSTSTSTTVTTTTATQSNGSKLVG